jgi:hypothetical protein
MKTITVVCEEYKQTFEKLLEIKNAEEPSSAFSEIGGDNGGRTHVSETITS